MAVVVLSPRALNRTVLSRQLLLERSSLTVLRALERVAGLQTQYAPSGYIGLWSRLTGFKRSALTRALVRRQVVQATMMRATIHMTSAADYGLFTAGVRRHRRQWWERVQRRELAGVDLGAAVDIVRAELAAGPRKASDVAAALADAGFPRIAWHSVGEYLDLVRVPPSGTWERRRADLYGLADNEVGPLPTDEDAGITHLLTRYLAAFGPAPLSSAANWAGLPLAAVKAAAQRLTLRQFVDGEGGDLVDLPRRRLVEPDAEAPVRFLPTWDATLLAHARHAHILPERFREQIFNTKTPQSIPTFLVDGVVAGTWQYKDNAVQVQPFEPVPRRWRRAVDEEAGSLQAWFRADG